MEKYLVNSPLITVMIFMAACSQPAAIPDEKPVELKGTIEQMGKASRNIRAEKKVKDTWPMLPDYFVGVKDDGTKRDGYAMYICELFREEGAEADVKIVDYAQVKAHSKAKNGDFQMAGRPVYEAYVLGSHRCRISGD